MTDLEKVKKMEELNWKPSSTYWSEKYLKEKARADSLEKSLSKTLRIYLNGWALGKTGVDVNFALSCYHVYEKELLEGG
jgi:hypothetical protein